MNLEEARALLKAADIFFDDDEDPSWNNVINLNDTFYWACADGERVTDADLPRVADLFFSYGMAGIYYWVAIEKRNCFPVEFHDVNRAIEFVRNEEQLRKEIPSSSQRAYAKRTYTIGGAE